MIVTLWYRVIALFKLLFVHDPVASYMDEQRSLLNYHVEEMTRHHNILLNSRESEILWLKQKLQDKDNEIQALNDKIIRILNPESTQHVVLNRKTDESDEADIVIPNTSWDARRNRLEELNSRKRNEELLKTIAEREAEIEEAIKQQRGPSNSDLDGYDANQGPDYQGEGIRSNESQVAMES